MSELQNTSIFSIDDVSDEEMSSLIDGTITNFDEGDLVKGTIVQIEHDEVLVDIGFKSEGVVPARELSIRKDVDPSKVVAVGDEIETLVLQKEDQDGRLVLSKKRADYEHAWNRVEEKYNSGEPVEGEVIEVVKGGLILDVGLRGFLPASLVDLRRVKDLNAFLGTIIEARVIEMDRNRNNVVLSRRILLEEARKAERQDILSKLQPGMRLKGSVSSIVEFGAFVDLGGIDGLIHISELSWGHINHPSEVVKVGDELEVQVLDVDLKRERISLGLKQTSDDPWQMMVKEHPVGSVLEGNVSKLVPFGIFVDLGEGVEGLVHISEMAAEHVEVPTQVVEMGDSVHVKVMEIDPERRRISLSMRAAAEDLGIEIEVAPYEGDSTADDAKDAKDESDAVAEEVVASAAASEETQAEQNAEAAEVAPSGEAEKPKDEEPAQEEKPKKKAPAKKKAAAKKADEKDAQADEGVKKESKAKKSAKKDDKATENAAKTDAKKKAEDKEDGEAASE